MNNHYAIPCTHTQTLVDGRCATNACNSWILYITATSTIRALWRGSPPTDVVYASGTSRHCLPPKLWISNNPLPYGCLITSVVGTCSFYGSPLHSGKCLSKGFRNLGGILSLHCHRD